MSFVLAVPPFLSLSCFAYPCLFPITRLEGGVCRFHLG